MTDPAIRESISIELPAHPQMVRVIRAMANRTADLAGIGYDRVEDLGLAVDETAAVLLALRSDSSLITTLTAGPSEVAFTMSRQAKPDPWPPADWADSIGGLVLESLASDVGFTSDEQTSSVSVAIS